LSKEAEKREKEKRRKGDRERIAHEFIRGNPKPTNSFVG